MATFLLGTGSQKNLRQITALLEKHLLRTEGIPRKISAWFGTFAFDAERLDFDDPFTRFTVRVQTSDPLIPELEARAARLGPVCTVEKKDGDTFTFRFVPRNGAVAEETLMALDQFCAKLRIPEVWRAEGSNYRIERISVELLFQAMVQYKASDVHLSPGVSPVFPHRRRYPHLGAHGTPFRRPDHRADP
jgi:hypothetical protein